MLPQKSTCVDKISSDRYASGENSVFYTFFNVYEKFYVHVRVLTSIPYFQFDFNLAGLVVFNSIFDKVYYKGHKLLQIKY